MDKIVNMEHKMELKVLHLLLKKFNLSLFISEKTQVNDQARITLISQLIN